MGLPVIATNWSGPTAFLDEVRGGGGARGGTAPAVLGGARRHACTHTARSLRLCLLRRRWATRCGWRAWWRPRAPRLLVRGRRSGVPAWRVCA